MGVGINSKEVSIIQDGIPKHGHKENFVALVSRLHVSILEHEFSRFCTKMKTFDRTQRKRIADYKIGPDNCLTIAVKQKSSELVEYLLKHCGADPNIFTSWKRRAIEKEPEMVPLLCWACVTGSKEIGKLLIQNGADVNHCNDDGDNLLHLSYRYQNKKYGSDSSIVDLDFIKNLLKAGIRVNHANRDRNTLLHLAHQVGDDELCKLLLCHGANTNLVNKRGYSPIEEAAIYMYTIEQEPVPSTPVKILLLVDKTMPKYKINALQIFGIRHVRGYLKVFSNGNLHSALQFWQKAMSFQSNNDVNFNKNTPGLFPDVFKPQSVTELLLINMKNENMIKLAILFAERIFGLNDLHTIILLKLFAKWYSKFNQVQHGIIVFGYVLEYILEKTFTTDYFWLQYFQETLMLWFRSCETSEDHHCGKCLHIFSEYLNFLYKFTLETGSSSIANQTSSVILYFVHTIADCPDENCKFKLYQVVNKLRKLNLRQEGLCLVYLAVKNYIYENNFKRKSLNGIRTMLEQGMTADTVDQAGDTPLMMCLDYKIQNYLPSEDIKKLLIGYSHLDIRNRQDTTPLALLKLSGYKLNETHYRTLQCLTAELIRKNKIPFKGRIPEKLQTFVELH